MKVTAKAQITLAALKEHDDLVTYSVGFNGTCQCIKMRVINNTRTYIVDYYTSANGFKSKSFTVLAAAKRNLTVNHF